MLLGEQLGGRHHRGLVPGPDAGQDGAGGDDGFARADVALQEAIHGYRVLDVVQDFGDGGALVAGELEGKGTGERTDVFSLDPDGAAGTAFAPFAAAFQHPELQQEEFVEG